MCETSMTGGWRCTPWGRKKSCPNLPGGCTTARVGPRSTASTNKKLRCAPTPRLKSNRSRELGFSTEMLIEHRFTGAAPSSLEEIVGIRPPEPGEKAHFNKFLKFDHL